MKTNEEIMATLEQLRAQQNVSISELARRVDMAKSSVSRYFNRTREFPLNYVDKFAKALHTTPEDLIGVIPADPNAPIPGIHSYPYIPADISAGTPERVDAITPDQLEQVAIPDAVMGKWAGHTDISLMRANGESMNRVIPNGSLIGVRKIQEVSELDDGDIVVFDCDGDYAVKRFYNDKEHRTYIFQPDSDKPNFFPITHGYDDEDLVHIVGRVVMYVVEL